MLHPKLRLILELGRVSNLPSALSNVMTGWLLAGGGMSAGLAWLGTGAAFAFLAGMTLNDAADARWDAVKKPERPIPSGRISQEKAWLLGLGELALAIAFFWRAGASLWWIAALVLCILGYNLYHKPWAGSVWVMAGCRFFLYLIAASATGWNLQGGTKQVWFSALALAGYVAGITLLARAENRKNEENQASSPKLLLLAPAITLVLIAVTSQGWNSFWMTLFFVLVQAAFVTWIMQSLKKKSMPLSAAVGWLLAGIVLVDAVALSSTWFGMALGLAALVPALRWFQRWIAAT